MTNNNGPESCIEVNKNINNGEIIDLRIKKKCKKIKLKNRTIQTF